MYAIGLYREPFQNIPALLAPRSLLTDILYIESIHFRFTKVKPIQLLTYAVNLHLRGVFGFRPKPKRTLCVYYGVRLLRSQYLMQYYNTGICIGVPNGVRRKGMSEQCVSEALSNFFRENLLDDLIELREMRACNRNGLWLVVLQGFLTQGELQTA